MSEENRVRISSFVIALALVAAPAITSAQRLAQTPPVTRSAIGSIDFGVRGTTTKGDAARYERYRDMGDGLFLQRVQVNREVNNWVLDFGGFNVGRSDQRFSGEFVKPGRFKGWAMWDQIPMLLSRTTRTLFVEDLTEPQRVLTIPNAIQAQAQAVPASMEQLFDQNSIVFETSSRRHIGEGEVEYLATPALTVRTHVKYTDRQGSLPYGGSFGHSSLVECPRPSITGSPTSMRARSTRAIGCSCAPVTRARSSKISRRPWSSTTPSGCSTSPLPRREDDPRSRPAARSSR
jgi:hypothetical protein